MAYRRNSRSPRRGNESRKLVQIIAGFLLALLALAGMRLGVFQYFSRLFVNDVLRSMQDEGNRQRQAFEERQAAAARDQQTPAADSKSATDDATDQSRAP